MQKALFGREARGLEEGLEALADALERHLDLRALHRALGLTGRAFPASPTEAKAPVGCPDPPPPPGLVLLLGGAKSGKSRFAQRLAGPFATLVATAEARDEEMAEKIRRHQEERPPPGRPWKRLWTSWGP